MSLMTANWMDAGSSWWRNPETGAHPGQDQGQGQSQAPGPGPEAGGGHLVGVGARVGPGVLKRIDSAVGARSHRADQDQDHKSFYRTLTFVVAL